MKKLPEQGVKKEKEMRVKKVREVKEEKEVREAKKVMSQWIMLTLLANFKEQLKAMHRNVLKKEFVQNCQAVLKALG